MSEQITIATKPCVHCGKSGTIYPVWLRDYRIYMDGTHVQIAFPDLAPALREQIISGTHPECWDEIFGDEEEDEDDQSTEKS